MDTIEYHPAGKNPKRVMCFSPHPDDDVISMGGSLIRLVDDGHEVHIAYMTSGNIAVFDHDARRVADMVTEYNRLFEIDEQKSREVETDVNDSLNTKEPGQFDIESVLRVKGLIRWSEAKAGALTVGCQEEHLHFLDLPFYRTGAIDKKPFGCDDVAIIRELIERVQPQQVYVAGDLSDPHGTTSRLRRSDLDGPAGDRARFRQSARGAAVSRRVARVRPSRNRDRRAAKSRRHGAKTQSDLHA